MPVQVGSTQIMLNSGSEQFPTGLANSSGVLGHYLMAHYQSLGGMGMFVDNMDRYYHGNRPNNTYIPRFRNVGGQDEDADFVRGYGFQVVPIRADWTMDMNRKGFGADLKNSLRKPGFWMWILGGFAECLPYESNTVKLHPAKVDRFGISQVAVEFTWGENEWALERDMQRQGDRILKAAGAVMNMAAFAGDVIREPIGGGAIHEMGTARMGANPTESVSIHP